MSPTFWSKTAKAALAVFWGLVAGCQTPNPAARADTEAKIQVIETQYTTLCEQEETLSAASENALQDPDCETKLAFLNHVNQFKQNCETFVSAAKTAYTPLSKRERRAKLKALLQSQGYLPAVEGLFSWGLPNAELAPYLAAEKTQPTPTPKQ
jgi:hypothetical protein